MKIFIIFEFFLLLFCNCLKLPVQDKCYIDLETHKEVCGKLYKSDHYIYDYDLEYECYTKNN